MSFENEIIKEGEFQYFEKGEGHTIIILHGLFGALSNFEELVDNFSKNYRVVVPIMPMYDMPILQTNIKNFTKYIEDFINYKQLNNFTVLGNSLGGHIALVYTKQNPGKVHSMVLTGSSGLYENAFGGSFPRREDKEYLRKKIALTFYDPAIVTDELVDMLYDIVMDRGKLIRVLSIAKSAIRHNMSDDIPNYKMPVCLIWGKNDNVTPPHVADEFHEKFPDSDLFWIDKCGHAPMMEHPKEFNQILGNWFKAKFNF
jgi:pimeloyl-ACP methyl ester carboxylesterase